eukprot:jgi/Bigna1/80582/fgenesh1_pg.72_\
MASAKQASRRLLDALRNNPGSSSKVYKAVNNAIQYHFEGGPQVSIEDAVYMLKTRDPNEIALIGLAADAVREEHVGDRVGYAINRNINFTNSCVKRCGFCAFSRTGVDSEAYFLPKEEVVRRAEEAVSFGATEICVQAGLPPNMKPNLYTDIASTIKAKLPEVHLHAFSPEEVLYGASRSKRSAREMLLALKESGVDTIPGTSAEILDDGIRAKIAGQRLSTERWYIRRSGYLSLQQLMRYGHIETAEHIAKHIDILRQIQRKTGGFTEFVPLSFVASDAPMYAKKNILNMRGGPSGAEVLLMHSVARLMLSGDINNLQCSWPKEGMRMAQILLGHGVNDLGGTLMNESISTAAGAQHGQLARPRELRALATEVMLLKHI